MGKTAQEYVPIQIKPETVEPRNMTYIIPYFIELHFLMYVSNDRIHSSRWSPHTEGRSPETLLKLYSKNNCLSKSTHCEVHFSKSNGLAIMVCKQF